MGEKKLIIDGLELHYKGLFDINELLSTIDGATQGKGYEKQEKRRFETVKPKGKEFSIELRPTKVKSDVETLQLYIKIHITNITNVKVLKKRQTLQKGNIRIRFDSWLLTDWIARWEKKPIYYFIVRVLNKYIWPVYKGAKLEGEIKQDTHEIYDQIEAFLNLYKH